MRLHIYQQEHSLFKALVSCVLKNVQLLTLFYKISKVSLVDQQLPDYFTSYSIQ